MRFAACALAHLLVDGVCAATLYAHCAALPDFALLVLLYNTLAFSTQCLVGLATDRLRRCRGVTAAFCLVVALGFLLPLPGLLRVVLVGLGNSVFHVSGGTETLLISEGRAWRLGAFVAPGAVGLALGTLFPASGTALSLALLLVAAALAALPERRCAPTHGAPARGGVSVATVLLVAVAVRAVGGTAAVFPWKIGALPALLMAGTVFAGKLLGGFAADKLGTRPTAYLSILPAALLIAFGSHSAALSLAGQFLLNLTMPVTLLLIYRALPDSPGFAFGLAASALWPGTLLGQLLTLTGPRLWLCVLLCFLAGLAAILWALCRLNPRETIQEESK